MSAFIRALALSDEPFLWEALYHAIYVPPGEEPPPRSLVHHPRVSRYVAGWGSVHDSGFIAVDAQPIGTVWLRLFTAPDVGFGYVDDATPELSIALLPGQRGRGVGSRLLARMLESARDRYPAVSLSVDIRNPALRLYQRFGFETSRADGNTLVMVKRFE